MQHDETFQKYEETSEIHEIARTVCSETHAPEAATISAPPQRGGFLFIEVLGVHIIRVI